MYEKIEKYLLPIAIGIVVLACFFCYGFYRGCQYGDGGKPTGNGNDVKGTVSGAQAANNDARISIDAASAGISAAEEHIERAGSVGDQIADRAESIDSGIGRSEDLVKRCQSEVSACESILADVERSNQKGTPAGQGGADKVGSVHGIDRPGG